MIRRTGPRSRRARYFMERDGTIGSRLQLRSMDDHCQHEATHALTVCTWSPSTSRLRAASCL